ncbi:MAG TPA: sugar kinase [Verrucomicrobiales bacterium]|nr:sugar kinase [Verrucomicrobiales bacterium]
MSRIITLGEIMGRLTAPGSKRLVQAMPGTLDVTFAGAEANVAVSIAMLGGEAAFVTALPDHAVADAVVANLHSAGVDTRLILRTAEGRLGLFYHEAGINQRSGNVIYDRTGSSMAITPPEAYDWQAVFAGAGWLHLSGITPAISATAADVALRAAKEAAERGLPVSCDMNFRSKLWQWDRSLPPAQLAARTMQQLLPFVTVFLGGREDAALLLDIQEEDFAAMARRIVAKWPRLTHVATTMRNTAGVNQLWSGSLYDAAKDRCFFAPLNGGQPEPYLIASVVDRLGTGDAFAAGLIHALTTPELSPPQTALEFAVAASCLAHSIEGDFNFTTRAEVEALMRGDGGGRVNR